MDQSATKGKSLSRRKFLAQVGNITAGVTTLSALGELAFPQSETSAPPLPKLQLGRSDAEDPLVRMTIDLRRALEKPIESRRWIMAIDTRKCVGCHACTVACIAENRLPPGVVYRPVLMEEVGHFPQPRLKFIPKPCQHCQNPPCIPVCPVEATWKRKDNVVVVDYDKCIGCLRCVSACPYGARSLDEGNFWTEETPALQPYELEPSFEYGTIWDRKEMEAPVGKVRKCHFCLHRVIAGELPACVTTCIGRATYFGDANDPESLLAQIIASPNQFRYKPELGTQPTVVYL